MKTSFSETKEHTTKWRGGVELMKHERSITVFKLSSPETKTTGVCADTITNKVTN